MGRRPLTGRADLLLALAGDAVVARDVAERLGYAQLPPPMPIVVAKDETVNAEPELPKLADLPKAARQSRPVTFWQPERLVVRQPFQTVPPSSELPVPVQVRLARFDPLGTIPEILTRLQRVARKKQIGSRIDIDRIVVELSRARHLKTLPRLRHRNWQHNLHVIIDLSRRLIPYRRDQLLLARTIQKMLTKVDGTISVLREGDELPIIQWPDEQFGYELSVGPGSTVLVLGDLGTLQQAEGQLAERRWIQKGRMLRERECQALAFVPCRTDAVSSALTRYWSIEAWDHDSKRTRPPTVEETCAGSERLLALLSPAIRIEPRLLRAVRKLIPEGRSNPGLEGIVWQMCQGTTHCSAAALSSAQVKELRSPLLDDELKSNAWSLIEAAHRDEYSGVLSLEVVNLGQQAARFGAGHLVEQSRQWFRSIPSMETTSDRRGDFVRSACDAFTSEAWQSQPTLHALCACLFPDDALPPGYDPLRDGRPELPIRTTRIIQKAGELIFSEDIRMPTFGSPLASFQFRNPRIPIHETDQTLKDTLDDEGFWSSVNPPAWAVDWGIDKYGHWCEFEVNECRQRMRWICPDQFTMGSPHNEPGHVEDEEPQHQVTISRGFWLFDTPCTQELWQAVTGKNPSRFKGARRPVEQVSWHDCRGFIEQLNGMLPRLDLGLPTEAQWEFACRAGTQTATYAGSLSVKSSQARLQLHGIAWYDGNSKNRSHDVGENSPNPWGLYDMLGNVWEWCDDGGRKYSTMSMTDPVGSQMPAAERMIRGGGWAGTAGYVRAAFRSAFPPSVRRTFLGFRCCSSGPEPADPRSATSKRVVGGRSVQAEPSGHCEPASTDRSINLTAATEQSIQAPKGPVIRIRSDLEDLYLRKITRPPWASAIGRDEFGLWAEFTVMNVRQRLRWIPPGRFTMGSPQTEVGRYDDEGPLHDVVIAEGYWLFDTPCTQELWQAVTGEKPSRFSGLRLPVEQVSWKDCQVFLNRLNHQIGGLHLSLPLESQWEYACRAGTTTPIWNGTTQIGDARHQKLLTKIAWYGDNSDHRTHEVATRLPNPWGLYDMIGNVYEWCRDKWRDFYDAEPALADRVIRGGSWSSTTWSVRAAYRFSSRPSSRRGNLGFRCSSSGNDRNEEE